MFNRASYFLPILCIAACGTDTEPTSDGTAALNLPPADTYFSLAVTDNSTNHSGGRLLFLDFQESPSESGSGANNVVVSPRHAGAAIVLDGDAADWDETTNTRVYGTVQNNYPLSRYFDAVPTTIEIASRWDNEFVYFLVRWEDAGHQASSQFAKWVFGDQGGGESAWNARLHVGPTLGAPNDGVVNREHALAGVEDEDRLFLMFPVTDSESHFAEGGLGCAGYCHGRLMDDNPFQNHTGMSVSGMAANRTGDLADVWQWQSSRSLPMGYADDQSLEATTERAGYRPDSGSAVATENGQSVGAPAWMSPDGLSSTHDVLLRESAVPFAGTPVGGEEIPAVVLQDPSGSRADVEARGVYDASTHTWTVELRRKLDTGASDDRIFAPGDDAEPPSAPGVSVVDAERGRELYDAICLRCHGDAGLGIAADGKWSYPRIQRTSGSLILRTLRTNPTMVSVARELGDSPEEVRQAAEDVAAYLQTQATWVGTQALGVTVVGVDGELGAVTSAPVGISCPGTCEGDFAEGAEITLTAGNVGGRSFTGWSGACSGTDPECVVTLSADRAVTATYVDATVFHAVDVTVSGPGNVTSSPAGIDCGGTCSTNFADNTSVTLSATPENGRIFDGWSGGPCDGQPADCTFQLQADVSVTVSFSDVATTECGTGGVEYDLNGTNGFGVQRVVNDGAVDEPTDIAFFPGSMTRFLVTGQDGLVHYFDGGCDAKTTLDIRNGAPGGITVAMGGERGLLNVEFHPDWGVSNNYVFFYHTSATSDGHANNSVSRMTAVIGAGGNLELTNPVRVIDFKKTGTAGNHNGGAIVFPSDKTLIASVGDGADREQGQATDNLLGAIIRISPDLSDDAADYSYDIPSGNMFSAAGARCSGVIDSPNPCPELLAIGLRNPYRISLDGDIVYIGEVGASWEEINSFRYTDNSVNFAWQADGPQDTPGLTDPILAYNHSYGSNANLQRFSSEDPTGFTPTGRFSVMTGDVYRGSRYGGALAGRLLHGEFMDGFIRAFSVDAEGARTDEGIHLIHKLGISAMVQGPDGYLYLVALQDGYYNTTEPDMIYRLVRP